MSEKIASDMTPDAFGAWRKQLGLTQAEAADRLGVSKRSIFGYENTGPIPKTVALACRQIAAELEVFDATSLVREQHQKLGTTYVVIPFQIERTSSYPEVLETTLSQEVMDWLAENAPSATMSLKTVITPTRRRIQVPVISFESNPEAVYFKLRWC